MIAIAVDDRAAKLYLSKLAEAFTERGIASNNMIADRYSEPAFLIEGKCTLSTVYKAKGNEAAVAVVFGCGAVNLRSQSGRNRLLQRSHEQRRLGSNLPRYNIGDWRRERDSNS